MSEKDLVRRGYDAVAAAYLVERGEGGEDVGFLAELEGRLGAGARVLDAGCGAGVPVTRRLVTRFDVVGVDFSEEQLWIARRLVPNAQLICQDLTTLALPDGYFDAIVTYYAIIHVPRDEHPAVLRNFWRM